MYIINLNYINLNYSCKFRFSSPLFSRGFNRCCTGSQAPPGASRHIDARRGPSLWKPGDSPGSMGFPKGKSIEILVDVGKSTGKPVGKCWLNGKLMK